MSSPFLGVYVALYDYNAQNEEELTIAEHDILYLLQKSDFDDWWTVKKRVVDANATEPQGLVPSSYIEPAPVKVTARALYDYTKQTEEEISFSEGAVLNVYDDMDPNWTLVGINDQQFGFVPSNYIEIQSHEPSRQALATSPTSTLPTPTGNILSAFPAPPQRNDRASPSPLRDQPQYNEPQYEPDEVGNDDDDEEQAPPPMPTRPKASSSAAQNNTNAYRSHDNNYDDDKDDEEVSKRRRSSSIFGKSRSRSNTDSSARRSMTNLLSSKSKSDSDAIPPVHADFAWKIHEIDNKKKRRGVLEIGNGKIYLDIENKLEEQWSIKNLTNYNSEKKHIFLDLRSPTYSFELYVSNKESAAAIISILGDMKGMQSEVALKEVKEAQLSGIKSNMKCGRVLYDFIGQGGDELTSLEGDKVYIINDKKSKDWWLVENSKGDRGVIPSNYIKIVDGKKSKEGGFMKSLFTGSKSPNKKSSRGSDKEELRLRERAKYEHEKDELLKKQREIERKEKELIARDREQREKIRRADEKLRERRLREEAAKSESNSSSSSNKKQFPNPHRVRTWIDRSGSFKVEAEFLGVQEGKIHLHKTNGVKIAVAANKLCLEDLEYVERLIGASLDKYKGHDQKKQNDLQSTPQRSKGSVDEPQTPSLPSRKNSSAVKGQKTLPINAELVDYWFNFFVESGVDVAVCERYARNFASEQVDEKVLGEITPALMRTLGVKEGDILRIKRYIDGKLGRSTATPEPTTQTFTNVTNGDAAQTKHDDPLPPMPSASITDDSWATKPASKAADSSNERLTPQITGSIKDLLDVKPMAPTKTGITPVKPVSTIGSNSNVHNNTFITSTSLPGETTGKLKGVQTGGITPMPITAMPTGFMPITMIPMMTGALTGALTGGFGQPMMTGGFAMGLPTTTFGQSNVTGGINNLFAAPQPQQKTGGFIMPLNTGGAQIPQTSFGINPSTTGGMVKLQPTGVVLQKTGGNSAIAPMQPTMRTGGFIPQSNFGMQMTGGLPQTSFGMNPAFTGGLPQTSFANPAITGGLMPQQPQPQASFGMNPALTGGLPQTSFGGNPALTGGISQTSFGVNPAFTGGFSQPSVGAPAFTGGFQQMQQQPQQQPQTSFGINPAFTGGLPQTSFGQQQNQLNNMMAQTSLNSMPLQSQPTGYGFGNSGVGKQANLANATADNPFGF